MAEAEVTEPAEELVGQVAAIDIAKASGIVCMRLPHPSRPGRHTQEVWNVPATTNGILQLGDRLLCQGVTRVVMEATGAGAAVSAPLLTRTGVNAAPLPDEAKQALPN